MNTLFGPPLGEPKVVRFTNGDVSALTVLPRVSEVLNWASSDDESPIFAFILNYFEIMTHI